MSQLTHSLASSPALPRAEWWHPEPDARGSDGGDTAAASEPDSAVGRATFAFLVAFMAILFLAPQEHIPGAGSLHLAQLAGLGAMATFGLERIVARRALLDSTPETRLALTLLGWGLLIAPLSFWPGGALRYIFDVWAICVIVFLLLSQVMTTPGRLATMFWTLTLVGVPIGLTAVKNFLTLQGDRILGYAGPLTENPNDLALTLNLFFPMTVALLLTTRRPSLRMLLIGILALNVVAILVTFSRSGFLTLALTGFLCMRMLPRRTPAGAGTGPTLALIGLALVAVVAAPSGYTDRLSTIVNISADRTGSATERLEDSKTAVAYIATHPLLGGGAGMSVLALNEFRDTNWTKVHNVYLEHGVDLGLPGLLIFLAFWHSARRSASDTRKLSPRVAGARLPAFAGAIEIALWAFALAALFHPVSYQFYFYYVAGMAAALRNGQWACTAESQS